MGLTAEQIEMRRGGVTATDLVALCGVDPMGRGPAHVFAQKFGPPRVEAEAPAMRIGHLLEPLALDLLARQHRLTLTPGETERHALFPWLMATPDARVTAPGKGVAEAKVVGARMIRYWGDEDDAIPEYVHVQVQVQMMVTRTRRAWVTALLGGTELRIYCLEHDETLAVTILEVAERFHRDHMLTRRPPPDDDPRAARAALAAAWPRHRPGMLSASPEVDALAREYLAARDAEAAAKARKEDAAARLCAAIGEREGVEGQDWRATWRAHDGYEVQAFRVQPGRKFDLRLKSARAGRRAA